MAAPNLKTPATITGKTLVYAVTDTLSEVLANAAASGTVLRVNTIRLCNISAGTVNTDVSLRRSSTDYYQAKTLEVAAGSTLVLADRNELLWLEEGDAIRAKASANSALHLTLSYELIT